MIPVSRIEELLRCFSDRKILVAGDVILDRYLFGDIRRISPEAPVPVLHIKREELRPGGAGNVAGNVGGLGARVHLIGLVGKDPYGEQLSALLGPERQILCRDYLQTVVKTRLVAQTQQVLRIDREENTGPRPVDEQAIIQTFRKMPVDGILVSDYAKGFCTPGIIRALVRKARQEDIPLLIDPKPANAALYGDCRCICPNIREAEQILGLQDLEDSQLPRAVRALKKKFNSATALITRGEKGMTGVDEKDRVVTVPALGHGVYDVTGAGDTVAAVLLLAMVCGAGLPESMELATLAASVTVERFGATFISSRELLDRARGG